VAASVLIAGCYGGLSRGDASATDGAEAGTSGANEGGSSEDGSSGGDDGPPTVECDGEVLDPGPNLVRRLTVREYGNTVEAVLGVDVRSEAAQLLPAELRADGFTNTASGLITTLDHVEGYDALAEIAVQRIPDLEAFASQYTSCLAFEDACERELVENLGRRAFRRPVSEDEAALLVAVFDVAQTEGESFAVGAGLVVEAMMQSPAFLYRLEDETTGTEARELEGYELATRLSYLLWAGPPDDALLDAAESDALRNDAEITGEIDRMLADPRAREASIGFVSDWLHLARLENLPRDPERFPNWSPAIAAAMEAETVAFFSSVAWDEERALVDLFDAQETWLTPELAEYYGLAVQGEGETKYDLEGVPERGGLLTQGSLLTIGGDDSSMVARGLFVFENILCEHPMSPPEGVDTTPPEVEPGQSQRDYSEQRTSNAACAGCHLQFEPLAWGLERYVADGTYATEDYFGNALREEGEVTFPGDPERHSFTNAAEFMQLLADAEATRECLGSKGTQFAIGRPLLESDDCSMGKVQDALAASDGTWRDIMLAIALSPGFRSIRVE
jgi:hypothetical protein